MFCWAVIFSIQISELAIKYSCNFPQSVIAFISLDRLIFVVTKMQNCFKYVKGPIPFHDVSIKGM
jgi:hypothetical protein